MTGAKTSAHDLNSVHGSTSSSNDFDGIEDSSHWDVLHQLSVVETTTAVALGAVYQQTHGKLMTLERPKCCGRWGKMNYS